MQTMSILVVLIALIISGVISSKCPYTDNSNNLNEHLENQKYEWTVVIKDRSSKNYLHISYGFVLSPQMILTSALAISGREASNLLVRADCSSSIVNCKYRVVVKIFLPNSIDTSEFYLNDYVLLILKKPFVYSINNPTFGRVKLTGNYSEINKFKCSIVRWIHKFCPNRFNKLSYGVNIMEDNFIEFRNCDAQNLFRDRDGIIFSPKYDTESIVSVSFYGSPIICNTVDSDHEKYLFGIAVFDAKGTILMNNTNNSLPRVDFVGRYANIVDNYNQLHEKIYEAKNYITDYNNRQLKKKSVKK